MIFFPSVQRALLVKIGDSTRFIHYLTTLRRELEKYSRYRKQFVSSLRCTLRARIDAPA